MAQHYAGMQLLANHKYRVLSEARRYGHRIRFFVLYTAAAGNPKAITEEIGQKEGEYIRQYRPVLNTQIPREDDWRKFDVCAVDAREVLKDLL